MYGGDVHTVTLKCKDEMANVIIDQFGRDVRLRPAGEGYFTVRVDVAVSDQFLGWVVALGGKVKVSSPEWVKEEMRKLVANTFVE